MNSYDIIVVGSGSIGTPLAFNLAASGFKTLVIDANASVGQGENKHAIGGVRATHSDIAKILTCRRSLEIFASFEEVTGDFIDWNMGGYLFPVYNAEDEELLKKIMPQQKECGLEIDFISPDEVKERAAGICPDGLRGGSFSPCDGNLSPLLLVNAYYRLSQAAGAEFKFNEKVVEILTENDAVTGLKTNKETYYSKVIIDAAGPYSTALAKLAQIELPVFANAHEAGITEPVERFLSPLIVDLRHDENSKNCYFYQNNHGKIIFCLTPKPAIKEINHQETSSFLPIVAQRLLKLMPRLKNLRVRRTWRGIYPMTPDGSPLVGWSENLTGLLHATGMCGQGLMIGPAIAETITRLIAGETSENDTIILERFNPNRDFSQVEHLK